MSENILWSLHTDMDGMKTKEETTIQDIAKKIDQNKIGTSTKIGWKFENDEKTYPIDINLLKCIINNVTESHNKIDLPINKITIIFAITGLLLIGGLFGFIVFSMSSNTDIGDKFDKFKNIAEALKEDMKSKTDSLVSFPSKLNSESTEANTSMTNLKKMSSELTTELNKAKGITDSVTQQAANFNASIKKLNEETLPEIGKLKNLNDIELFDKKFTEILKQTLSTENLAAKIMEKDSTSGKKFITSLTEGLLSKEKTDIDNLRKKFAEKLGEMTVESKKALITGIINSYNQTESETKNKLAQDLVKGLIDKGSLQQAIAKVVAPSKRKAIIIPTQDFNPATKDKALFIELMKKLLAKKQIAPDELKVFIDRNGRLVEINEENKVNVLNENFNDVISNINGATINDFLNSTDSKYDCVFIRGPDSNVVPEIINAVWFNGNRCSVIYTVKVKVTNDDYPRLNQWRNLTILNQGKLRMTILKATESANDSAESIIKEIDGIN
jgi:hypothetical protein